MRYENVSEKEPISATEETGASRLNNDQYVIQRDQQ
jgi:hypothetical protein